MMLFDKIYHTEEDVRHAYNNLMLLFVSAIKSNGGRLAIKDHDIIRANSNWTVHRYNDSQNKEVIFTLKDKVENKL